MVSEEARVKPAEVLLHVLWCYLLTSAPAHHLTLHSQLLCLERGCLIAESYIMPKKRTYARKHKGEILLWCLSSTVLLFLALQQQTACLWSFNLWST